MAKKEPRSYLNPREAGADNVADAARVFILCARAARAEARGKSTKRLEARMDRIQKEANARWDAQHPGQD